MSSDLGDAVLRRAARSLKQQRNALTGQISLYSGGAQRNSPAETERRSLSGRSRRIEARKWILAETVRQAGRIASNGSDHALGLEKSLEGKPEAQFCTMTLCRAVLDAASRVCYLLDPATTLETRLLRGAALLLDSSTEEVTAVRNLPPFEAPMPDAQKVVTTIRDNVEGWIKQAGMYIHTGPKGKPSGIASDSVSRPVSLKMNASDESAKHFPDVPAAYRMTSGVAHSMPWMLHDPDDRPSSVLMAAAAADASLKGCIKISEAYAGYYGHDFAEAGRRGRTRYQAVALAIQDYVSAGNHSLARYINDPRLQPPPSP